MEFIKNILIIAVTFGYICIIVKIALMIGDRIKERYETPIAFEFKTSEDAVFVVRCKDCRKNGTDACAMFCKCDFEILHSWNDGEDFCSWGERKSE